MKIHRGFSLIELMVVLAIAAILYVTVIPSYQRYVLKGDRSDGVETIQGLLLAQQEYHLENLTYTTTLGNGGLGLTVNSSGEYTTPKGFYTVSAEACKNPVGGGDMSLGQCIQLRAKPDSTHTEDGELIVNTMGIQQRKIGTKIHTDFE